MKNAKELMLEYTAFSFRDPKMAPLSCRILRRSVFLHSRGRDAIAGFFQSVLDIYPGFQFENIKVLIDTPDQVFAEFEANALD